MRQFLIYSFYIADFQTPEFLPLVVMIKQQHYGIHGIFGTDCVLCKVIPTGSKIQSSLKKMASQSLLDLMVPFTHGILTGLFTIPSPSFVTFLKNSKLSFWYWSILEFFSNIFRQKKTPNNFKPNGSYGCSKIAVQK